MSAPVTAALFGSFHQLGRAVWQIVRDPYRFWVWLQLPLWLWLLVWSWQSAQQWLAQPLAQIEVSGELKQLDAGALEQQLWQHLQQTQLISNPVAAGEALATGGSYVGQDLAGFKQLLEEQPWVSEVAIQRRWPDQLQVRVREQRPVARWGEQGLVNEQGVIFSPAGQFAQQNNGIFAALPQLSGPDQRSLSLMAQYRDFNQLLRPLGISLTGLEMEARGAWTLQLNNGIQLIIGRGQSIEKLRRFSQVYGSVLKRYAERIERVDVRYTNGLAVTWREPPVRKANKK